MSLGLTFRQSQLLRFLKARKEAGETCPSFDEMVAHTGASSKSRVHALIQALEDRGHIRRLKGRARAIEIIDASTTCPHCGRSLGSPECRAAADAAKITYSSTPAEARP